jgi:predicted AAA+ superfamily ATPase
LLIIDEAQYIPDIGRKAKLMIDEIKPLHIILTGSSAFDIIQSGEPLVGRTISYQLYPVAQMELQSIENPLQTRQHLEERLIYGGYPELLGLPGLTEKQAYLRELINTYLLKDILAFENIRQGQKLRDLLVLLARQIGNEVSQEELGRQLGISKNTVARYLDLLSKVFVIYSRGGFSRNLRKEVVKSQRWYFADNGIRNALINQFSPLALRQDTGQLWENYFISERQKRNAYYEEQVNCYYWRTYDQQEIDLIEEKNGQLTAFECKWKEQKVKVPVAFANAYPEAKFILVHQGNYEEWVV